jgi:hypothetical protein
MLAGLLDTIFPTYFQCCPKSSPGRLTSGVAVFDIAFLSSAIVYDAPAVDDIAGLYFDVSASYSARRVLSSAIFDNNRE